MFGAEDLSEHEPSRCYGTHRCQGGMGSGGGTVAAATLLNLMVSAHMEDFKAGGPQAYLNWLRDVLSKAFGGDVKMEQESSFIHTGINTRPSSRQGIWQVPLRLRSD